MRQEDASAGKARESRDADIARCRAPLEDTQLEVHPDEPALFIAFGLNPFDAFDGLL